MKVGSLFSGIAGLELGLMMAEPEAEVIWQAECDPYALAVLAHHFPAVRRYKDVREIDASSERPDVICGGFPCQPHSLAGKRRGTSDERWIWPEFARIIADLRPSCVFVENVPGLRTSGLRDVLADLAGLGFDAEWDLFQAAEAGGPHRRRRLFVFAHSGSVFGAAWRPVSRRQGTAERPEPGVTSPPWVASNSNRVWQLQPGGSVGNQWRWTRDGDRWSFESSVPGVDDGTPGRVHRERLCGNACVPQQAAIAWRELKARAFPALEDRR